MVQYTSVENLLHELGPNPASLVPMMNRRDREVMEIDTQLQWTKETYAWMEVGFIKERVAFRETAAQ